MQILYCICGLAPVTAHKWPVRLEGGRLILFAPVAAAVKCNMQDVVLFDHGKQLIWGVACYCWLQLWTNLQYIIDSFNLYLFFFQLTMP